MNLCLPISSTSMSYISLSTNLVANCDIQVDGTKVADIFGFSTALEQKFSPIHIFLEAPPDPRRGFYFPKIHFSCKEKGGGVKPPILLKSHPIPIITLSIRTPHHLTPQPHLTPSLLLLIIYRNILYLFKSIIPDEIFIWYFLFCL